MPRRSLVQVRVVRSNRSRLDRCQKINIGAFIIYKMQMERASFSGETVTGNRERRGKKKSGFKSINFFFVRV